MDMNKLSEARIRQRVRDCASSWEKRGEEIARRVSDINHFLDDVAMAELPDSAPVSASEGYAYYGLYPETYLESANAFFHESRPHHAVCIGVGGIGASLSALVVAALERRGVTVNETLFVGGPGGRAPGGRVVRLGLGLLQ